MGEFKKGYKLLATHPNGTGEKVTLTIEQSGTVGGLRVVLASKDSMTKAELTAEQADELFSLKYELLGKF